MCCKLCFRIWFGSWGEFAVGCIPMLCTSCSGFEYSVAIWMGTRERLELWVVCHYITTKQKSSNEKKGQMHESEEWKLNQRQPNKSQIPTQQPQNLDATICHISTFPNQHLLSHSTTHFILSLSKSSWERLTVMQPACMRTHLRKTQKFIQNCQAPHKSPKALHIQEVNRVEQHQHLEVTLRPNLPKKEGFKVKLCFPSTTWSCSTKDQEGEGSSRASQWTSWA